MKRVIYFAGLLVALGLSAQAGASGPIGVYGIVEKVVLEPGKDKPDRAQIWGTFALAKDNRLYSEPLHGYLYYKAEKGSEDICRKEWADLQKVAGTGQVIGFADSYFHDALGKVRKTNAKAESPDVFPLGNGVVKIGDNANFSPIQQLRQVPTIKEPSEGDLVPPGEITLTVRNILDKNHAKAAYVFTLESATGEKEVSKEIQPGAKETKWTPTKPLKKGAKYTWHVHGVEGNWKGPAMTATFLVKG